MSANYWIKLYIEILNDSKMAVLPDRLWRRTVELFAAAGHYNDKGNLPDTQQLAWLFRMNTDDLELDLKQIATTGIIQRTTTGWLVTKFEERQAPVSGNERVKQFRQRQQKQQYYGDVTEMKRDVTQRTEADTDTDTEAESTTRFRVLFDTFLKASNINELSLNLKRCADTVNKWMAAGTEPEHIIQAVNELRQKNYDIAGPWSITNSINIVRSRVDAPAYERPASEVY